MLIAEHMQKSWSSSKKRHKNTIAHNDKPQTGFNEALKNYEKYKFKEHIANNSSRQKKRLKKPAALETLGNLWKN